MSGEADYMCVCESQRERERDILSERNEENCNCRGLLFYVSFIMSRLHIVVWKLQLERLIFYHFCVMFGKCKLYCVHASMIEAHL